MEELGYQNPQGQEPYPEDDIEDRIIRRQSYLFIMSAATLIIMIFVLLYLLNTNNTLNQILEFLVNVV